MGKVPALEVRRGQRELSVKIPEQAINEDQLKDIDSCKL